MKKGIFAIVGAVCMAACSFFGCARPDGKYFEKVSNHSYWDNIGSESIAQYKYYDIMDSFLSEGEIVGGDCIKDGKIRKILFIGWDGTRADAMENIMRGGKLFNRWN